MSKEYTIKTHDVFNFSTGWLDDNVGLLFYEVFLKVPIQHHSMTLAELYNYEIQDFNIEKKRVEFKL